MADRKILNKYIDPNFNHEKLVKLRKPIEKQDNVRMMLPFSIRCDTCGNYLRIGTKINMRKETVIGETYLGIPIYRFYMKCCFCYTEMTMTTDPKNHDYLMEQGAVRLYESWKDARAAEELLMEIRKNEEEGNTMKYIENKTYDSKREMDTLEAIDEIRVMSKDNARLTLEQVVDALNKRDYALSDEELRGYLGRMEEMEAGAGKGRAVVDRVGAMARVTKAFLKRVKVPQVNDSKTPQNDSEKSQPSDSNTPQNDLKEAQLSDPNTPQNDLKEPLPAAPQTSEPAPVAACEDPYQLVDF